MALDSHIKRGQPIFFGLLCFFAFIEGCITSWLVSQYNRHDNYPSGSARDRLRFLVFVSWWTFLFTAVYIGAFLTSALSFLTSIASHAAWLILTWIFWTAGAASITAAYDGGQNCSNSSLVYCNQNMAAEAFAWISWIIITIATVCILLIGGAAIRRGDGLTGSLA